MKLGTALVAPLLLATPIFASSSAPAPARAVARPALRALTPAELQSALKAGRWLIVEFGGEHCIPCMRMQPVLQDLQAALGGKAEVRNFWIQEHPDVAERFRIMVMPTQLVFDPKGEEVFRHMGYFPPAEFHKALREKGLL